VSLFFFSPATERIGVPLRSTTSAAAADLLEPAAVCSPVAPLPRAPASVAISTIAAITVPARSRISGWGMLTIGCGVPGDHGG
jgi:hypothetical protein